MSGPNSNNYYYTDQGISVYNSWMARTSIGASWGGTNTLYGTGYIGFNFRATLNTSMPWNYLGDGASNGASVIYSDVEGNIYFCLKPKTGGSGGSFSNNDLRGITTMKFMPNGKVLIGNNIIQNSNCPGGYNLYVENGILTERVKVALKSTADWADYVFRPEYQLRNLYDVKCFIEQNGHLPDVPSAETVQQEGIDVAQMDAILLKKMVELTLYIIDLKKQIDEQQKQIESLQKQ